MSTNTTPRPAGMHQLSPHLVCAGAADAIVFYEAAFDAVELMRLEGAEGRLVHASVSINGSSVMLVDENLDYGMLSPKTLGGTPVTIHLIVADVDEWVARAVAAGAVVLMPVDDMFWGDRYGIIQDPFGHCWSIATPQRAMSAAELADAMSTAMTSGM
jgi:PhnB protein